MSFPDPWHSCPRLPFMPIPTLVICCCAAGGMLRCVHLVCGGGGRVDRDDRDHIECRAERGTVLQGSLGRGTRRGGTVSRKVCRTLSGNAKRYMGMGNLRDLRV